MTKPARAQESTKSVVELELIANEMRHDIIRMLEKSKSGHPGGSLSATDILAALWFSGVMNYDPTDPRAPWRDRFILSKGHAAPGLYAAFKQVGFVSDDDLMTLRTLGSKLQGHPDPHYCSAVEVCSGSLGQGLSVSAGLALGFKKDVAGTDEEPIHVWCVLGDGEMQEGSNWEALMFAAHQKLNNLTVILDQNNLQIDGHVTDVNSLGDIDAKFAAFGYYVMRANGHDMAEVVETLFAARAITDQPVAVIFDTVKGKGVSFMEDKASWHGNPPNHEQAVQALAELDAAREAILEGAANV